MKLLIYEDLVVKLLREKKMKKANKAENLKNSLLKVEKICFIFFFGNENEKKLLQQHSGNQ